MAKLRGSIFIMTGGVSMPEAGPRIEHPHDSSTWLLDVKTKVWEKCEDCECMKRAGHMMMVHKENVYVVGGYTYEHHRLKKLFLLDEVIEAAGVTKDIIITRKIVVTNLTGKNLPNITDFPSQAMQTLCTAMGVMKSQITNHTVKISTFPTTQNVIAISY